MRKRTSHGPPLSEHEIIFDFDASLRGNSLVPKLLDKSARDSITKIL